MIAIAITACLTFPEGVAAKMGFDTTGATGARVPGNVAWAGLGAGGGSTAADATGTGGLSGWST